MSDVYQTLILDHAKHPRHWGLLPGPCHRRTASNRLCGDQIELHSLMAPPLPGVGVPGLTIGFEAKGCALCKASASIMAELLTGKTPDAADGLVRKFMADFQNQAADQSETWRARAAAVAALFELRKFPTRERCVLLAWEAMAATLADLMSPAAAGLS